MRSRDLMKDPFYAGILFAIESKIHEGDRLAASRGITLTDSNIRSLLIKTVHAARGKLPQSVPASAGAKDQFLAEFLHQLIAAKDSVMERQELPDGTLEESPLPCTDWIKALEAAKESCAIRTGDEPGSRGYLDFLADFIPQAGGRK
ncbi:MAG: hypothetical protein WC076_08895 [Terrimicrobiaceae bacterium]|jgi:hypothetical protein|nr:hypothetical protein [Terrimicrobiaceae bacterium]